MSAYLIAQIKDIKDNEVYKQYVDKVSPIVEKFGGKFLTRGGEFQTVEGTWEYTRNVLIEFPSYEKAVEWYNSEELKPVKQMRLDNSISNAIIIKGI